LYSANFDFQHFSPYVFSARRLPDGIHYRMVKCDRCGLVRSDPVAEPSVIEDLYSKSDFGYTEEVANLKRTYGCYLKKVDDYVESKEALLEIGCGNGFFLEEALSMGYKAVRGIEPSRKAVEASRPDIHPHITCDMMRAGLFREEEFDVICMFQVLDHISDPSTLLNECFNSLKPGGVVFSLNHNVEALSAKLLGESSPIVDIEHTFLFSKRTIARLFEVHKFEVKRSGWVLNSYAIRYFVHLAPLSKSLKQRLLSVLAHAGLDRIRLSLPLGNLYLIAQKPVTKRGTSPASSR
jgi:SAM-dependent methyltransferase